MAGRCVSCDRESCPLLDESAYVIVREVPGGKSYTVDACKRAPLERDCDANRVDWRARAIADGPDAARWREVAPLIEAMRAAEVAHRNARGSAYYSDDLVDCYRLNRDHAVLALLAATSPRP